MNPKRTLKGKTSDWIVSEYISGKTLQKIADEIGCSKQAIHQHLQYCNIPRRPTKTQNKCQKYKDILKGLKKNEPLGRIVPRLKTSATLVKRVAQENKIPIHKEIRGYGPIDRDWLYTKYIKEYMSVSKIAKLLKITTYHTVFRNLKQYGIPVRPRGRYVSNNMNLLRNKLWLYKAYVGEGLSIVQLAKMSGSYYSTVQYWLKKHQIPNKRDPQIKSM